MQITGFIARFVSSFIWLKMYRLGIDQGDIYRPVDVEARAWSFGNFSPSNSRWSSGNFSPSNSRGSFGNFSPSNLRQARQSSLSDEVLGGSIYNPTYYSSLFYVRDEIHSSKEVSILQGCYLSQYFHTKSQLIRKCLQKSCQCYFSYVCFANRSACLLQRLLFGIDRNFKACDV